MHASGLTRRIRPLAALAAAMLLAGCAGDDDPVVTPAMRAAAVAHADPTQLRLGLERIAQWHSLNDSGLALRPPLPAAERAGLLGRFPCEIPEELRVLWEWRDGEDGDRFVWYHRFLPLADAVEVYDELFGMPLGRWSRRWIPVFEFEGEWYGVECADSPRAASPVIHYFLEDEPRVVHRNLGAMIDFQLRAQDSGALHWGRDNWAGEPAVLELVHRETSPGYPFPYAAGP